MRSLWIAAACALLALGFESRLLRAHKGSRPVDMTPDTARVEDLGEWTPHGNTTVHRLWVFPNGSIAYTLRDIEELSHAVSRRGPAGKVHDMKPGPGYTDVEIHAANDKGDILWRAYSDSDSGKEEELYIDDGKSRYKLYAPAGYAACWPRAMNNAGTVVGTALKQLGGNEWRACIWKKGRPEVVPGDEGLYGVPRAINGRGEVLFGFPRSHPTLPRFAVFSDGKFVPVNTTGWQTIELLCINNKGDIAGDGMRERDPSSLRNHVLLVRRSKMRDLGAIPGGSMQVRDMNDAGMIVGAAYYVKDDRRKSAFLWTEKRGFTFLSTLLPAGSRWYLYDAFGIDAKGRIFGVGSLRGKDRFFRLTLPPGR